MTSIELPWPPKELLPNKAHRRYGHFGYKRKAKIARTLAWGLTAQALGPLLRQYKADGDIVLRYQFQPPMRAGKAADEDNVMAALKPYRDGIADALGVNDSRFRNERPVWLPKSGEGRVIIEF